MDFFKQQDLSARRSYLFFGLFWLSIALFTVFVYFLVMLCLWFKSSLSHFPLWHNPMSFIAIGFTLGPIIFEAISRVHEIKSRGASSIIETMDVRYIESCCEDHLERRLKNVVEEMAVVSNQSIPTIYVLNEFQINALTVATNEHDVCLGVTQGALDCLHRDELQALIANQFAQIINGDAIFKTHMIGWLHGILFVQRFGERVLEANMKGDVNPLFSVVGFVITAIGYAGYLQAFAIKRIFCRQRQYLADAFAVQYTRNPDGLGGALKKSKNNSTIAMLMNSDVAHLFFSEPRAVITPMHPCINDRLDIIYEGRPGRHENPTFPQKTRAKAQLHHRSSLEKPALVHNEPITSDPAAFIPSSAALLVGLEVAIPTHFSFPMGFQSMELTVESAKAAVLFVLGQKAKEGSLNALINQFGNCFSTCEPERKLRLIDQAALKLTSLSPSEIGDFGTKVKELIRNDGNLDLFEFMVFKILQRRLKSNVEKKQGNVRIDELIWATRLLLSATAISGSSEEEACLAFDEGARDLEYEIGEYIERIPTSECHWGNIEKSLTQFESASESAKAMLIRGLRSVAKTDKKIEANELYFIQGVCAAIDMPMPELTTIHNTA